MIHNSIAVGILFLAATARSEESKIQLATEKYSLANGLEVILHEDHKTPIVAVNVWYHVGSKDEPKGRNGFAHLFEHLMFQGSKNVGEDMFFKYLERAGASDKNGTTNPDRTNYFETVPANQLKLALWLESDRMGFLLDHVNQNTLNSQRDVVKNERRQNYENAPYGMVSQLIASTMYPVEHPYRLLTIGTPEDLDAATLDDVRTFFKTFYVPNNATLTVAGDIDRMKAKQWIEQYFGPIQKGIPPTIQTKVQTPSLDREIRLNVEANVELARVYMSWPTPPWFAKGDAELDILSSIMSSGKSSRLYKKLVYDEQVAQDVHAYQHSQQLSGMFEIVATIKKGKSVSDVIRWIDEELAQLQSKPVSESEFQRAITSQISNLTFQMESITSRANWFNSYNQFTKNPDFFQKDLDRYRMIQSTYLMNTVETFLPRNKRILTIVTPNPNAPRAGRLVGGQP